MSDTMKAMLLTEPSRLELVTALRPRPEFHEALVRVRACGICGSDVHGFDGSSGRRIPPLIMGHEAAGVIEELGSFARESGEFSIGDRVTFDSTVYCGKCRFCRRGEVNLCDNRMVLGVSCGDYHRDGAFAEYVVVPTRILYRLPDELPFEHAAMIEAVSVAVHAANRTPLKLGDTAVVVGAGMIGLLVIQAIRHAGCGRVIAVDLADDRLQLAKELGATDVINAREQDTVAATLKLTGGVGADAAFEVIGSAPTVNAAIGSVRKGGSVTLVGNLTPQVELPLQAVVTRELTLIGTCASAGEYPACIDLMAREIIRVAPLITAAAPLEDGPRWFDRLHAGEAGLMKVLLQP